jgi:hypothetical protein
MILSLKETVKHGERLRKHIKPENFGPLVLLAAKLNEHEMVTIDGLGEKKRGPWGPLVKKDDQPA